MIVFATSVSGPSSQANADEPRGTLAIHLSAPSECPSESDLRLGIQRLLLDPNGSPKGVASVAATISQTTDGRYSLLLDVVDPQGASHQRQIEGETCAAVVDAAAVAIALAGDTASQPAPRETAPPPPNKAAPPPSSHADTKATGSALPERTIPSGPTRFSWDLEASAGADFASLPSPSPGFGLAVTKDLARNQIIVGATAWIPERATLASHSSSGAHIGLYVAKLRYGRSLLSGRFDLVPSGGIEVGALVAKGSGVESAKVAPSAWVAPVLGLSGFVHISSGFALSLELEGLVPLVRPRFDITSGGQVYQPPPVTARAIFGAHAQFP